MESLSVSLYVRALEVALLLALPVVSLVTLVGIVVGLVQAVVQIQDQNVSFAPKLVVVALLLAAGGAFAMGLLRQLFVAVLAASPDLARG
jgi:flagellar biosynthesis protein FliQ